MDEQNERRLWGGVGVPMVCGVASAVAYYYPTSLKQYYLHIVILVLGYLIQLTLVSKVNIASVADKMLFQRGAAGFFVMFTVVSYIVVGAINGI